MGSAVGQVPEYCEQITRWVMEVAKIPVIVKLTPNISDIVMPARAAVAAGANALSLIIRSIPSLALIWKHWKSRLTSAARAVTVDTPVRR